MLTAEKLKGFAERVSETMKNVYPFKKMQLRLNKYIVAAEVIKAKLDIDLFPLIIPVATKGFDMSGGTAAFRMIGEWGEEYLFEVRAKDCHSMKGEYYSRVHPDTKEICIGRNR